MDITKNKTKQNKKSAQKMCLTSSIDKKEQQKKTKKQQKKPTCYLHRKKQTTCYLHRSRNVKRAYIRRRPGIRERGEYWGRGVGGRGKATPPAGPVKNCLLRP